MRWNLKTKQDEQQLASRDFIQRIVFDQNIQPPDPDITEGIGSFVNGQPDGLWKFYDANGHVHTTGHYNCGRPIGEWKYFTSDGYVYREINAGN